MTTEPDICRNTHGGNAASEAAYAKAQASTEAHREWIYRQISTAGQRGMTSAELADLAQAKAPDMPTEIHRVTPRIAQLAQKGRIAPSVREPTRKNSRGNSCTVYVLPHYNGRQF